MLTVLLLACVTTPLTSASADEAQPESVRTLQLTEEEGTYMVAMPTPAPVIAGCANENGRLTYGPSEDVAIVWLDGVLYVSPAPDLVDCTAWTWR